MRIAIATKLFQTILLAAFLLCSLLNEIREDRLSKQYNILLSLYIGLDVVYLIEFHAREFVADSFYITNFTQPLAGVLSGFIFLAMALYIFDSVPGKARRKPDKWLYFAFAMSIIYLLLSVVVTSIMGLTAVFTSTTTAIMLFTGLGLAFSSLFLLVFQQRKLLTKQEYYILYGYLAMMLVDFVLAGLDMMTYHGLGATIMFFLMLYTFHSERNRRLAEVEKELAKIQQTVMQAQMKPHFIFNTLATIRSLCVMKPEKGIALLDTFSSYLRGNIDNFDSVEMVPFEKELQQLMYYIEIETVRFPRIKVEYDIQERDFTMPMFILQPIVENSIKHGLRTKRTGGTITIKTSTDVSGKNVIITVSDNGDGFDVSTLTEKGGHIGISNTRKRLKEICGGNMFISSTPDEGTETIITFERHPVEIDFYEEII